MGQNRHMNTYIDRRTLLIGLCGTAASLCFSPVGREPAQANHDRLQGPELRVLPGMGQSRDSSWVPSHSCES